MIEPKRFQTRLRGDLQLLQVCHIKPDAHVDALLLKVGHKVIVRELCCGDWDFLWLKPPKFENAATDGKKIFSGR